MNLRNSRAAVGLAAVVLVLLLAVPAFATPANQASFVAAEDVTLDQTVTGNRNAYPLQLAWSVNQDGVGSPTKVFLLKFNIGADPLAGNAVAKARLNLATIANPCGAAASPVSVAIYKTTSSTWTETAATWATVGPGQNSIRGDLLDTSDTTLPPTGPVYWTDAANGLFAQYVNGARATGVVSLWVEVAAGTTSNSNASFENWERIGQKNNCAGATIPPTLQIADLGQPLSVDVSAASAQQATSWPLYAGLAAVALLVILGVTITRRRTA